MLDRNMHEEALQSPAIRSDQPCVLVLAAGKGERYIASGGSTHKLQAILGAETVLQNTLRAVQASGLAWHVEYGPHPGMGDSIAAAVKATQHSGGWLILPADLPLVLPETLRALALHLSRLPKQELHVIQPFYQGRKGHPVAFSQAAGQVLCQLTGEQGAASVVRQAAQAQKLQHWQCDDIGCVLDVDTVHALEQARQVLAKRLQIQITGGGHKP